MPTGAAVASEVKAARAEKVLPVAHNAGELWPRQAFIKKPGRIVMSIGPAFEAGGLSEQEINARAREWIEAEMRRLSPHRYPDENSVAS